MRDALDIRRRHEDAITSARLRILLGQSRDAMRDSTDRNSKSLNTLSGVMLREKLEQKK